MLSHIEKLSQIIVDKKGLRPSNIDIRPGSNKGEGFLGDIYMVDVIGVDGKKTDIVVKSATDNEAIVTSCHVGELYGNEEKWYSCIFPELERFQEAKRVLRPFGAVPAYYGSYFDGTARLLALENLRSSGFQLFNTKSLVDGDHVEKVFVEFGKLHGVSFVYRHEDQEAFEKLTGGLFDSWDLLIEDSHLIETLTDVCEVTLACLREASKQGLVEPFQKYLSPKVILKNAAAYTGRHPTLTHRDSWSNNLMFKYKSNDDGTKQLECIRILDWQMIRLGSPVHDLSYFLYSSSSKDMFDNLDYYLEVYYDSLSKTIKDLGYDSELLYPFHILKSDWKKYSTFGFMLGLLTNRIKLTHDDDVVDFHDTNKVDSNGEPPRKMINTKYDAEVFKERAINLVKHMCDIGVL